MAEHCKGVILLGEDAEQIQVALQDSVPVTKVASMEEAVSAAASQASAGDVVLLSPACASFDMFTGYEQRGRVFCEAVDQLAQACK